MYPNKEMPLDFRRLSCAVALVLTAGSADAQTCPCPPAPTPGWHGGAGVGIALTSGNSDTQSFNVSVAMTYDPLKQYVVKLDGLYLRSRAEGEDTAEKATLGARGERKLGRAFLFADGRYERDRFKELSYLLSPAAGIGYTIAEGEPFALSVDAGVGFVVEKLFDQESTTSGALRAGQTLTWRLSPNARFTQLSRALWKTSDLSDAFYHLEAGLSSSISQRLEMKLGAVLDVKNEPASPELEKTDTAVLASLVFKL
jgi:putative salt-induced outer membrane protein